MAVEAVKSPAEGRVLLRNASWVTYERLIDEREERRVPRFFYDRGVLEIMSPSAEHDRVSRVVALFVEELAVEMNLDVDRVGSMTYKRGDFSRGFEPGESFYFSGNAQSVRGKSDIDLDAGALDAGDLPPDLVSEADATNSILNKLPIYARLGVKEVWRYAGGGMAILGE